MPQVQRGSVNRFTVFGKAAVAGLLIAWVFAAAFLSSDRHLHDTVHHDSAEANHQCAITVFERGETLSSEPVCTIVWQTSPSTETELPSQSNYFSSFRILNNTTRGPPV